MTSPPRGRSRVFPSIVLCTSVLALVLGLSWSHQGRNVAANGGLQIASHDPSAAAVHPTPSDSAAVRSRQAATRPVTSTHRAGSDFPAQRGAVAAPSQLLIPGIHLDMRIKPVGVNDSGQMDLPDRPEILGWYRFGPAPGAARGSAVLAGHVDSRQYGIGPLAAVNQLQRGEPIVVTSEQGARHYQVDDVKRVSKRRLDLTQLFARDGKPQLHIVTCGGDYDPARGGYQDNVIVTATLH